MVQDEQETNQEEFSRAVIDGDAEQEVEPGAAPRDCATGSSDALGSGAGCVYFIRSPDGAFVKIGFTARSVLSRVTQIGQLLPGMKLLGYIPGTRGTERWLHGRFTHDHERGEWFRCSDALMSFIAQLGLMVVDPVIQKARNPHPLKGKKNAAAVALGKLAASKRSREDFAEAGRRGMASRWGKRNGTAAALETETELAESTSQTKKRKPLIPASKIYNGTV